MERPIPTQPRFATVTTEPLQRLVSEYEEAKRELENMKSMLGTNDIGWQRRLAPEIKEMNDKARRVEQELQDAIELVEENFERLSAYIQSLMDTAKATVATAKSAVNAYESVPDEDNLLRAVSNTALAAQKLEGLAQAGKEADLAYGQAWFKYRANPAVPEGINKDAFYQKRMELMTRGKAITAKVEKLAQLTVQAKAYKSLSKKLSVTGKREVEAVKKSAVKLEAQLADLLNKGILNRSKLRWGDNNFMERVENLEEIAVRKGLTAKDKSEAATRLADIEAAVKAYRNQFKTMDTVLVTGLKTFTPKNLKTHSKLIKAAEKHVKDAKLIVAKADDGLDRAKKAADKIRRA
jgi:hypothetical protein